MLISLLLMERWGVELKQAVRKEGRKGGKRAKLPPLLLLKSVVANMMIPIKHTAIGVESTTR